MWSRKELKMRAKAVLKVSYWKSFLVSFIIAIVGGNATGSFNWNLTNTDSDKFPGCVPMDPSAESFPLLMIGIFIGLLIVCLVLAFRIFLGYPLEVGGRRYFVQAEQYNADLNYLGYSFDKEKYLDIVKTMVWRGVLNFLWFLLLIIPGSVKMYAYQMVPYILADNPNIGHSRAVKLSRQMTDGQKFSMFVLDLSFIGWCLLGLLAFFVGIFFVLPYINATKAELYLLLRQNALDKGMCSYEELRLPSPL